MRLAAGNWPVPFSVTMAARGELRHVSGDIMQHAQPRNHCPRWRPLSWTVRGALAAAAGLAALGVQPALPAWAGSWSSPTALPGSCGSSVAVNQSGAMVAGGTFTAADGSTHVRVCTSTDGKTWQAADLGPGGDLPSGGQRPVVAVGPDGRVVAVWGSSVGCPGTACEYIVQADVRPAGGSWGALSTLSTFLSPTAGEMAIGADGSGNVIAAWVESRGGLKGGITLYRFNRYRWARQ